MSDPLFISFYTPGYAKEAKGLVETLDAFRLEHDVREVQTKGEWAKNTRIKPSVIMDALLKHPERRLVYLDADARVRKRPELFWRLTCDVAIHTMVLENKNFVDYLAGTIYLSGSPECVGLIARWSAACKFSHHPMGDQPLLKIVLEEAVRHGLKFETLPPEYTFIFDRFRKDYPGLEPVIEHMQKSRQTRGRKDL